MDIKVGDIVYDKSNNVAQILEVMEPGLQYRVWLFGYDFRLWLHHNITHVNGVPVAPQEDATPDWETIAKSYQRDIERLNSALAEVYVWAKDAEVTEGFRLTHIRHMAYDALNFGKQAESDDND